MERRIVSRADWLKERAALLSREKELTRLRDALAGERRTLPWVRVAKEYAFDGPDGREGLGQLFAGRSQLLVYHFMFDPDWDQGCKSGSFWADSYDGIVVHLAQRDLTMITVSRAPFVKLDAFRRRKGWRPKWVSSFAGDFSRDFWVSFTEDERQGNAFHIFRKGAFPATEAPGISVFHRSGDGAVFHTYSCYARGLGGVSGAYQLLDLTPKGHDEGALPGKMAWVRHHDQYGA